MFYFRLKGTESIISVYHVIKYKSRIGENARKAKSERWEGKGKGPVAYKSSRGLQGRKLLC